MPGTSSRVFCPPCDATHKINDTNALYALRAFVSGDAQTVTRKRGIVQLCVKKAAVIGGGGTFAT